MLRNSSTSSGYDINDNIFDQANLENQSTNQDDSVGRTRPLEVHERNRAAILMIVMILSIALNGLGIGLSGTAMHKDDQISGIIRGSQGLSFADDCWSCDLIKPDPNDPSQNYHQLTVKSRMETHSSDHSEVRKLFTKNGFAFTGKLQQHVDAAGPLADPQWKGNAVVADSVFWRSFPRKQAFTYSTGVDQFTTVPSENTFHDQYNPGRKYCSVLSPLLGDVTDSVYMYLSFQRACYTSDQTVNCDWKSSSASIGYWPAETIQSVTYPCINYLGTAKLFYCVPESLSTRLGCSNTNIDAQCDRAFESSTVAFGVPASYY